MPVSASSQSQSALQPVQPIQQKSLFKPVSKQVSKRKNKENENPLQASQPGTKRPYVRKADKLKYAVFQVIDSIAGASVLHSDESVNETSNAKYFISSSRNN